MNIPSRRDYSQSSFPWKSAGIVSGVFLLIILFLVYIKELEMFFKTLAGMK